jgi:hypothetical protein
MTSAATSTDAEAEAEAAFPASLLSSSEIIDGSSIIEDPNGRGCSIVRLRSPITTKQTK